MRATSIRKTTVGEMMKQDFFKMIKAQDCIMRSVSMSDMEEKADLEEPMDLKGKSNSGVQTQGTQDTQTISEGLKPSMIMSTVGGKDLDVKTLTGGYAIAKDVNQEQVAQSGDYNLNMKSSNTLIGTVNLIDRIPIESI